MCASTGSQRMRHLRAIKAFFSPDNQKSSLYSLKLEKREYSPKTQTISEIFWIHRTLELVSMMFV